MKTNRLEFGTILVATDLQGSDSSALHYAQAIASQHCSRLVVVHVIDPVSYAFPSGNSHFVSADADVRKELKQIEDDIRLRGITVHSVLESGVICDRILQSVKDHHADLLILGTKAKSEVGRAALGSVTRQLLVGCPCPILAVSPTAGALLSTAGCWRRILVATDFSEASLAALQCAQSIVRAELLVLHATDTEAEHECEICLERLRFLAPMNESHTVPVEHIATRGDISKVILQHMQKFNPDLIVLGSPCNQLSSEKLSSSTVLNIISHAKCPVLCVPTAEVAEAGKIVPMMSSA